MRFKFERGACPKRVARRLQNWLSTAGYEVAYTQCLKLSSRLFWYSDWSDLRGSIGLSEPSIFDEDVSADICKLRKASHLAALTNAGVRDDHAEQIIAEMRPTARRMT